MPSTNSLNKILKISALACAGVGLGIFGAIQFNPAPPLAPSRHVASVGGVRPVARLPLGKQVSALRVYLSGPATIPDSPQEIVELTGTITQNLESDGGIIAYTWTLPPGVDLVRGPLASTLSEVALGQPRQVSIIVKGFTRAKQKLVSLSCQLQKGGQDLNASAVIVSRPEDTAEAIIMDLGAQASAAAAAAAESGDKDKQ